MTFPLPLPLTDIEHYMLAEDSASYPCCFSIVLRLSERIDAAALREAIAIATGRHPLLCAHLEYEYGTVRNWIAAPSAGHDIQWRDDVSAANTARPPRPIDLRKQLGVRFEVETGTDQDTLRVEFHHACTDGIGAVQFLSDLLIAYRQARGATESRLPAIDASRLTHRDQYGLRGWRRLTRLFYGTFGWLGAIEFFTHRPVPLGQTSEDAGEPAARHSGYCFAALSPEQSASLLAAAKQQRVTVNDLVIRDLFLSVQEHVAKHQPDLANKHKRVMVPTNLRVAGDEQTPATNIVAMINLDRRPGNWKHQRRLLRVLHWEMAAVKRMRLGLTFVQIVGAFRKWFGSLRPLLPLDRCLATCVLSNLGRSPAAFDPQLVRAIEFYPPLRPLTSASFGLITHDGQVMCSLHYDQAALSSDLGAELLEQFTRRLGGYATAPGGSDVCGDSADRLYST